jgi:hypothetical protein
MDKKIETGPKVGVILLNWNGAEFTIPCVKSLQAQTFSNIDIIVVDNGSTDDSLAQFQHQFEGGVKVLRMGKNLGFTGGNNVGIEFAMKHGADYILILNNDTVADPKFVEELVKVGESDGTIGIVTGKIFYYEPNDVLWYAGGDVHRGLLRFSHRGLLEKDSGKFDTVAESQFITGCCMLVRRGVFEKIGLFDNRFFIYAEDADLSLRALRFGYKLQYTPHALLWHKESASMRKNTLRANTGTVSPSQYYLSTRNFIFVVRKHSPPLEKVISISYLIMKSLVWSSFFIIRRRGEKLSSIWKGVIEGLSTDLRDRETIVSKTRLGG